MEPPTTGSGIDPRNGGKPNNHSTMESTIDLSADTIDVRDIIARVEELENDRERYGEEPSSWRTEYPKDAQELDTLSAILDELKGYGGDEQWRTLSISPRGTT